MTSRACSRPRTSAAPCSSVTGWEDRPVSRSPCGRPSGWRRSWGSTASSRLAADPNPGRLQQYVETFRRDYEGQMRQFVTAALGDGRRGARRPHRRRGPRRAARDGARADGTLRRPRSAPRGAAHRVRRGVHQLREPRHRRAGQPRPALQLRRRDRGRGRALDPPRGARAIRRDPPQRPRRGGAGARGSAPAPVPQPRARRRGSREHRGLLHRAALLPHRAERSPQDLAEPAALIASNGTVLGSSSSPSPRYERR